MKWLWKALVLLAVLTLVFAIGGMVYVVRARYAMNEYIVQVGAAFNAATLVNADETHTDADKAVTAHYSGRSAVIVPENYKALQNYLRRECAMPLFGQVKQEGALYISFCNQSHMYLQPDRDGQGALVRFETAGEDFLMHINGGDLWDKVVQIAIDGRSQYPNLPLQPAGQNPAE